MSDCVFCKIAAKEIPSDAVYEDDEVIAFRDLSPQAPTHVLIIPKKHIASVMDFTADDKALAAHIICDVIPALAEKLEIAKEGFRVVTNAGEAGGQTVPHLHFHLLGGRDMAWPPG